MVAAPPEDISAESIDIAALYRTLSPRLEQIVRNAVRAPDAVIEEACQYAWGSLVEHPAIRRECALSWLAVTAEREAWRLLRGQTRDLPLHVQLQDPEEEEHDVPVRVPAADELLERRERLTLIRQLPERQQRFLWLHALGLSYTEIATYLGCTTRTVERQLLRARKRIRELAAD